LSPYIDLINENTKTLNELNAEINDIRAKLNILMVKTDELIFDKTKAKDNKYNFITQILVIVFAAIITGILRLYFI
jgi:hypothetical protein